MLVADYFHLSQMEYLSGDEKHSDECDESDELEYSYGYRACAWSRHDAGIWGYRRWSCGRGGVVGILGRCKEVGTGVVKVFGTRWCRHSGYLQQSCGLGRRGLCVLHFFRIFR